MCVFMYLYMYMYVCVFNADLIVVLSVTEAYFHPVFKMYNI